MNTQKIYLSSLGCPKNQVDAEVMARSLVEKGFAIADGPEEATVIVVNTCAFILPAKEESIDEILRMAEFKKDGTGVCRHLVVTGCLPQRYGEELRRELPEVDLFLGTSDVPRLAGSISERIAGKKTGQGAAIGKPTFLMNAGHGRLLSTPPYSAYLKIAEGCSNRCSYCVIPDIRGDVRSRKPDDILKEAESLVRSGVREVILIAQDTTAYGADLKGKPSLQGLLRDLASLDALKWIRILYTYPAKLTEELFQTMADVDKVCPYIDMPIQHAEDVILSAMNRRGDRDQIEWAIRTARAMIPGVALRTSLIVGFPGETPLRFGRLLDFVREARFDHLGAFVYSREDGTEAARQPSRISEKEKIRRRDLIMEEQSVISHAINRTLVGSEQEVVIEGPSDLPGYAYVGRSSRQAPEIDGVTYIKGDRLAIGDFIRCRIVDVSEYDLFAEYGHPVAGPPVGKRKRNASK